MSSTRQNENSIDIEAFLLLKPSDQQRQLELQDHTFLLRLILFCLKKNPGYLVLLRRYHDGTSELFRDLALMKSPTWDMFLALDQETGDQVFKEVLLSCLQKYDILEIEALLKVNAHQKRISRVLSTLDPDEHAKLMDLTSLKPHKKALISDMMPSFVYFGGIGYKEGLLACAQIKHQKKKKAIDSYDFCPTLLKASEFKHYLMLLRYSLSWPLRERFLISDTHWISGDIQIDIDGKAHILFLDSLGGPPKHSMPFLEEFNSIFSPEQEIFFSAAKRQYSGLGCSAFALDDVQHLFTLERYLKDSNGDAITLFDFLSSQKNLRTHINVGVGEESVSLSLPSLPLSLIRTMQSRQLYNIIQERTTMEQEAPINRKGETAAASAQKGFFSDSNERVHEKLRKMADKIFLYLKNTDPDTLQTEMEAFSLNHLLLRCIDQLKNEKPSESAACIMRVALSIQNNAIIVALLESADNNANDWINATYGDLQYTPLTYAVKKKDAALITVLVKHGADPDQEDGFLRIPKKLAGNDPELIEALKQKPDTPSQAMLKR